MEINLLFKGLIIGLSIAAPVGAIGLLCINRTLSQGSIVGFISGLGAATADGFYGCIAGFGLTLVADFLIEQQFWLKLVGGVFLCFWGVNTFVSKPARSTQAIASSNLIQAYFSTLLLTIANPSTILSFVAVFAGLGLADTAQDYTSAAALVFGVFLGSASWWLLLSGGVGLVRRKFDSHTLRLINRVSGFIIVAFGLAALFSLGKL
ncbi:LysE family transporter [Pleurocapsales cyanobacterium LEGE 10410]|nr:LysE family transporter [Pleurocapsales cyanobacterium LEGE 10410]